MKRNVKNLSILFLVILFALALTGCTSLQNSVQGFFDAVKNGDLKKAAEFEYANSDKNFKFDNNEQKELITAYFSHMTYSIESTSKSASTANVKVKIKNVDISKLSVRITKDYIAESMKDSASTKNLDDAAMQKAFNDKLITAMKSKTADNYTKEVTIKVVKKNGKWLIVASDDLEKALVPCGDTAATK